MNVTDLAYCFGKPDAQAALRVTPDDFIVDESLAYALSGEGEHIYLRIRKRCLTTMAIAERLAKFTGLRLRDIGYAGLKDKHAVTTQWFSVYSPKTKQYDWSLFEDERVNILEISQHQRKCRLGALSHNDFIITLKNLSESASIADRMLQCQQSGMPNYYGEQRFGHDYENLKKARALFNGELTVKNHRLRGLYYSSARSHLFNLLLDARVQAKTFNHAISGDILQHVGKRGYFSIADVDDSIRERISSREVAPAGPLWGKGQHYESAEAEHLLQSVLTAESELCQGLENHGLELAYRPYVVFPENIAIEMVDHATAKISFRLPRGSFATSLLRELVNSNEA